MASSGPRRSNAPKPDLKTALETAAQADITAGKVSSETVEKLIQLFDLKRNGWLTRGHEADIRVTETQIQTITGEIYTLLLDSTSPNVKYATWYLGPGDVSPVRLTSALVKPDQLNIDIRTSASKDKAYFFRRGTQMRLHRFYHGGQRCVLLLPDDKGPTHHLLHLNSTPFLKLDREADLPVLARIDTMFSDMDSKARKLAELVINAPVELPGDRKDSQKQVELLGEYQKVREASTLKPFSAHALVQAVRRERKYGPSAAMAALPDEQLAVMSWGRKKLHILKMYLNKAHDGPLAQCKAHICNVEDEKAKLRFTPLDSTLDAAGKADAEIARSQVILELDNMLRDLKEIRGEYRKFNAESSSAFECLNKAEGDFGTVVKAAAAFTPSGGYRARLPSASTWSFEDTCIWLAWLKTTPPQNGKVIPHFKRVLKEVTDLAAK